MLTRMFGLLAVAAIATASPAAATIKVVYDTVPTGQSSFDTTVTNAGGTSKTTVLTSDSDYTDFSLSKTPSDTYNEITGLNVVINPSGLVPGPNGDSRGSGVTFNFKGPVNAFGLNVGDWGTCCFPSALYIAFDGGPAIQVGLADDNNPALRTNGEYAIFAAAFDDSGSFNKVEFWGDGFGEYLVAGGTIRYALLDQGTLPGVPEPATWALMILGFGAVGGAMRRRSTRRLAMA